MSFYHLPTTTERHPGYRERKVSDGALIGPEDGVWDEPLAAACGFVPVVDAGPPDVSTTETWDRHVEVIAGAPTAIYDVRAKTTEEIAASTPPAEAVDVAALSALIDGATSLAKTRDALRAILAAFTT